MGIRWKSLFVQICGEIFIIGGTIAAVAAALFVLDPHLLGANDITVEPASSLTAFSFLLLSTGVGFTSGLAMWIYTMRRFSNRAQLYKYLTEPYIPVVSDLVGKAFDIVYEAMRKPHGLERPWR